MAEYIDRQTVLQCIKESRENIDWGQSEDGDAFLHYSAALYRTIASKECLPSAVVEPIRHGRWVEENPLDAPNCRLIKCSECGKSFIVPVNVPYEDWIDGRNFCYGCGARMDGGQDA